MKITKTLLIALFIPFITHATEADDAKLTLAREVIASMHADKMFDQLAGQMQQMAAQSMNLSTANLSPEKKAAATKVMGQVMTLSMESAKELLTQMDTVYANVYSDAELQAMKAFFTSAEGQSMLAKQPQIMAQMMPLVQNMQKELMPKIQALAAAAKTEAEASAEPDSTK
jgi:hypothetical protein